MRELLKMVAEKREREVTQDLQDNEKYKKEMQKLGYDSEEIEQLAQKKDFVSDEEYQQLMELMKQETGYHLDEIEDEEEHKAAWVEWVQDKF